VHLLKKPFDLLFRAGRTRALWLGVPLLLYVWTLTGPFLFDDLHLLLKTERYIDGESTRLDLFRFAPTDDAWRALRDRGTYPWWAPETQRIDLLRPLAECSFWLDVRLFGRHTVGHRAVSLAWFALALICIHRLYAVASGDSARAGVATFLFGISQTVTQPVTFISNRSDLLVLVGATLAASAYWRAGQSAIRNPLSARGKTVAPAPKPVVSRSKKRSLKHCSLFHHGLLSFIVPAAVGFAFALLSKETAVALAGVFVVHELLTRRDRVLPSEPVRPRTGIFGTGHNRTAITIMVFVMATVYLAYYAATRPWHLGLTGGTAEQGSVIVSALRSLPLYCAVWTTGFPISILLQAHTTLITVVASVGAVGALIVAWHLRRRIRETDPGGGDPAASFFILWAVLFLLPALLTNPETRVLCPATIGWAYLLACLLAPARRQGGRATPLWLRHWLFAANGAVGIACAVGTILISNNAERQASRDVQHYLSVQESPLQDGDAMIVAEARSPLELICAGDRLEFLTGRKDLAFATLTFPGTGAKITRQDDHTLILTATSTPFMATPMHRRILGPGWKPKPGDRFRLRDFTAEIAAIDENDAVTALRLRFARPLASRSLHFYPPDLADIARGSAPTSRYDSVNSQSRPP